MNNDLLPVVILAGGLATRLRPVTETIPKALIKINDKVFIDHQLQLLHQHGVRQVVLCVSYLGDMVESHIGNGARFGMNVQYSYDGPTLLGTAGAIKQALPLLSDEFFVLYGDSYLLCDYKSIQHRYFQAQKPGLMTVYRNHGQWDTSNVEYADNKIIAYDKNQRNERMHYIDYGLGILNKQAFSTIPANTAYDLAVLYQTLLSENQLAAYEVNKRFFEVGSFTGINELEDYLSENG